MITIFDLFIFPIYFTIVLFLCFIYYRKTLQKSELASFFFPALIFKILCGVCLGLLFQFYFGNGDTFVFFRSGKVILDAFSNSAADGFRMLFLGEKLPEYIFPNDVLAQSKDSFLMYRITAVISFLSGGSYSVTSIFFSLFSFIGCWQLCIVLYKIKPELKLLSVIIFLFFPSIVFWGSGVMIDSLCVGFNGLLFASFLKLIFGINSRLKAISIILICSLFLSILKDYIFLAFIATILLYLLYKVIHSFKSRMLKLLTLGISLLILASVFVVLFERISEAITSVLVELVLQDAVKYSDAVGQISDDGSSYQLVDDIENVNLATIVGLFPMAVGTAIYRPFLWEANNVLQLVSALENLLIMIISIWVFIRVGLLRFVKNILNNKLIFILFVYSIIFAFAVGIASGNFGSLSRYRIPFMPIFFYLLGYLYFERRRQKKLELNHE